MCVRVYRAVLSYLVLSKLNNQHRLYSRSFSVYFCDNVCVSLSVFVGLCFSFSGVVARILGKSHQELQVEVMEVPTIYR